MSSLEEGHGDVQIAHDLTVAGGGDDAADLGEVADLGGVAGADEEVGRDADDNVELDVDDIGESPELQAPRANTLCYARARYASTPPTTHHAPLLLLRSAWSQPRYARRIRH